MYEERRSSSPHVQFVWRALPNADNTYSHKATEYWSFFFTNVRGVARTYVSGPATKPRALDYVGGGEYWGIVLKEHVFMPSLFKKDILNLNLELPTQDSGSFAFNNTIFSRPTYETAEAFVDQLIEKQCIVASHIVADALSGSARLAPRTIQRHVATATGMTRQKMASIQRARKAFMLLQEGMEIAAAAAAAGYADQSHLTKSLRLLIGQTPAQILTPQ